MNPYVTTLKHMIKLTCSTCDVCGLWYQHQTVVTKHYLTEIQTLMMQYIDPSSWCDGVCDHQIVWFGSSYCLSDVHSVNFNAWRCCPMLCLVVAI